MYSASREKLWDSDCIVPDATGPLVTLSLRKFSVTYARRNRCTKYDVLDVHGRGKRWCVMSV
jgi:hypothetical protein